MNKEELIKAANGRCAYNIYNGIKVVDIGDDFCVTEGELRAESMNPWGMAHGGFVYSLCDVAAGVLISKNECRGVTLGGNMQYLRPSVGKKLRAEARLVKRGRSLAFVHTDVYNDEGTHTATGEFQIYIKSKDDEK